MPELCCYPDPETDARWGAGRLDVAAALGQVVERKSGCRCLNAGNQGTPSLIALLLIAGLRRRRRLG
jgi:MYXO-CTERM domain-containing protein